MGDLGKLIVATSFECLPKVQESPNLVTLRLLRTQIHNFSPSLKHKLVITDSFSLCGVLLHFSSHSVAVFQVGRYIDLSISKRQATIVFLLHAGTCLPT